MKMKEENENMEKKGSWKPTEKRGWIGEKTVMEVIKRKRDRVEEPPSRH